MNSQNLFESIQKSHATMIEIPRGFGVDFAKKMIDFPENCGVNFLVPTIHDNQKTAIINVDDIEDLREKVITKTNRKQFFLILQAEKMNEKAQNKFLKSLEEPTENVHFVLITENRNAFLSTILSRVQIFKISKLSEQDSNDFLSDFKIDEAKKRQILFLASGLPAEMQKLANDKKYFAQESENMEFAKRWISGGKFEKLLISNEIKGDREKTLKILELILKILKITLKTENAEKNAQQMSDILQVYERISKNGNIRIELMNLALK